MPMIRFHPDSITWNRAHSYDEILRIVLERVIPEHREVARTHPAIHVHVSDMVFNLSPSFGGDCWTMTYRLSEQIDAELPQSYVDQVAARQAALAMAQQQQATAARQAEIQRRQQAAAAEAARQAEIQRQQVAAAEAARQAEIQRQQVAAAEAARQAEIKRQQTAAETERLAKIVREAEIFCTDSCEMVRQQEIRYKHDVIMHAEAAVHSAEAHLQAVATYQKASESLFQFRIQNAATEPARQAEIEQEAAAESIRLAEIHYKALGAKERISECVRQARIAAETERLAQSVNQLEINYKSLNERLRLSELEYQAMVQQAPQSFFMKEISELTALAKTHFKAAELYQLTSESLGQFKIKHAATETAAQAEREHAAVESARLADIYSKALASQDRLSKISEETNLRCEADFSEKSADPRRKGYGFRRMLNQFYDDAERAKSGPPAMMLTMMKSAESMMGFIEFELTNITVWKTDTKSLSEFKIKHAETEAAREYEIVQAAEKSAYIAEVHRQAIASQQRVSEYLLHAKIALEAAPEVVREAEMKQHQAEAARQAEIQRVIAEEALKLDIRRQQEAAREAEPLEQQAARFAQELTEKETNYSLALEQLRAAEFVYQELLKKSMDCKSILIQGRKIETLAMTCVLAASYYKTASYLSYEFKMKHAEPGCRAEIEREAAVNSARLTDICKEAIAYKNTTPKGLDLIKNLIIRQEVSIIEHRLSKADSSYQQAIINSKPLTKILELAEEVMERAEVHRRSIVNWREASESFFKFKIQCAASEPAHQVEVERFAAAESVRLGEIYDKVLATKERVSEYVRQARIAEKAAALEEEQRAAEAALAETEIASEREGFASGAGVSAIGLFAAGRLADGSVVATIGISSAP